MPRSRKNCINIAAVGCLSIVAHAQPDAVLIERLSPAPAGFYTANSYGSGTPQYLYSRFHSTRVVSSSHPVVAPALKAFVRIEETSSNARIVLRDLISGDSIASHAVPRGSSNVHWTSGGRIVFEVPPVAGVGALVSKEPYTGRTMDSTLVERQYMVSSSPSQGACIVAPTLSRFAFVRVATTEDGAPNVPIPAYQEIGSSRSTFAIAPYTTARVNGKEEKRVLIACGPTTPRPIRHLSWNSNATSIAFHGIVSFDRPFPTDTTRTYRVSTQGIFVVDIFFREVREIRSTQNVSLEHPDQFFFAPDGPMLAYTVQPNGGRPSVYLANAETQGPGVDIGSGKFITGQTTSLVWHCSPWSRTGGRLIIDREDGSLGMQGRCGSDAVLMDGTTQQISIASAQSSHVDARPFTPSVVVVNPWPDLVTATGTIRDDAWMMLPRTRIVRGCAADGASRLVFRIVVPQWMTDHVSVSLLPAKCAEGIYGNAELDGSLSNIGSELRMKQVSVKPRIENGVGICGVVYHAPEDFVAEGADTTRMLRTIRLAVSARDVDVWVDIEIVRPPLILVHGIWSSASLFNGFAPITSASSSHPKFIITRLDYSNQSTKRVDQIIGPYGSGLPVRLEAAVVNSYRDHVALRADVVGHSLGPILMRYMAASRLPTFFTARNNGMGHVNKLISLDSPHFGSEYCSLLGDVVINNPNRAELLNYVFTTFILDGVGNDPITGGVVDDLRPTSALFSVISFLEYLSLQPRIHTVTGVVTKAQEEANNYIIELVDAIGGLDLFENTFSRVFRGEPNDLIVSAYSQRAGILFSNATTRITQLPGVAHSDGFSETIGVVNPASGAAPRVLQLLNAPSNSEEFSAKQEALPRGVRATGIPKPEPHSIPSAVLVPTPRITITGPPSETLITPGTTHTVTVESVGALALQRVMLVYRGTILVDSAIAFSFACPIPINSALGPMKIIALGIIDDTTSVDLTAELTFNIQGPNSCRAVYIAGDTIVHLDNIHNAQLLSVVALFEDGHERRVELDANTTFTSRDPRICMVVDGWLTMIGEGAVKVFASRCGHADSILVVCSSSDLPPVADAGMDTVLSSAGVCQLSAIKSYDPEQGPLTFKWWVQNQPSPGMAVIAGPTSSVTTVSVPNIGLTVVGLDVADSTGKHDTTWKFIRVEPATSVSQESDAVETLSVFPNPCSDQVTITNVNEHALGAVALTDMIGTLYTVPLTHVSSVKTMLDVSQLAIGRYYLSSSSGARTTIVVLR